MQELWNYFIEAWKFLLQEISESENFKIKFELSQLEKLL